jgi:glucose/arabinose dehydrogenase
MPAFRGVLAPAEIRGLVAYIREMRTTLGTVVQEQPRGVLTSEHHTFRVETVAEGLVNPWSMAFLAENRIAVTELDGRLRIVEKGRLLERPVAGTPVTRKFNRTGGLMEIALHPDYARNGWIYLSYADIVKTPDGREAGMTCIVRGRIRDHQWMDQETIWKAKPEHYVVSVGGEYGARLAFDRAGDLYFTHGDREHMQHAQDLGRPNGKVHRVAADGKVPATNPFFNQPGALSSVWSWGNRNPQGLAFDPNTGLLWESEHGPTGGDELNIIRPGKNYGWPVVTYGFGVDGSTIGQAGPKPGMEEPVTYWTPSIAIAGIGFYQGSAFPKWQGNLFVTSLREQHLRRLTVAGDKILHQEVLLKDNGRMRTVLTGPDGFIYVVLNYGGQTEVGPGVVIRLVPAP